MGESSEAAVRAAGAVPATVGILDGVLVVGLSAAELRRFGDAGSAARKVGARDLAACCVQGALGATTVGGTLAAVRPLGIEVMATGGLGGVHREFPAPPDISSDLGELARTRAAIVSCGVKSLLDVPATSRAAGDARDSGARLSHGHAAAVLLRRGRPARLRARRVGRGGCGRRACTLEPRLARAQSRWHDRPSRASTTSSL